MPDVRPPILRKLPIPADPRYSRKSSQSLPAAAEASASDANDLCSHSLLESIHRGWRFPGDENFANVSGTLQAPAARCVLNHPSKTIQQANEEEAAHLLLS